MTYQIGTFDAVDLTALALALMAWIAFWVEVRNAIKADIWYRRLGSILLTAFFGLYWFAVAVARMFFDYHGPSIVFTTLGMILQGAAIAYLLGVSIVYGRRL